MLHAMYESPTLMSCDITYATGISTQALGRCHPPLAKLLLTCLDVQGVSGNLAACLPSDRPHAAASVAWPLNPRTGHSFLTALQGTFLPGRKSDTSPPSCPRPVFPAPEALTTASWRRLRDGESPSQRPAILACTQGLPSRATGNVWSDKAKTNPDPKTL